jgi:hypothetical protein
MENAAGDGRDRGRTGRWSVCECGCCWEGGRRGRSAQWEARIREWIGKTERDSWDEDFDDETARMCVGYVVCDDGERSGMEREDGRCDLGIELGRWEGEREEIPASICGALERRPLRMYSGGTFVHSGAAAMIASRDTSAKGGRASVRGS